MIPSKDNTFCFYPFYAMVFKLWKKNSNELRAVAPCCMMHDTKDITGIKIDVSYTATNPVVITSINHELIDDDKIEIYEVNGDGVDVGPYTVTVLSSDTFSIPEDATKGNVGKLNYHMREPNSILTRRDLKGLSPHDIFHHKKFEELRKNLLNNVRDSRCSTCWNQEDLGIMSHRMYTRWQFPEKFKTSLKEIDISISNKCNLACRMCNTGSSHQLNEDVNKLRKNNKLLLFEEVSDNGLGSLNLPLDVKNNHLIQWIYHNTDKIKILKASGGEPLYDRNILNLLRKYVKDGNSKSTELQFHTNAMLITDKIIKLMDEFKLQRHSFSIDGVDKTYNYIRHKANFSILEKNIKNWFNKSNNIYAVNINLVLSALNIGNDVEFLEWTDLMFHDKIRCNVFISEVRPHGRGLDIANLPISYLEKIRKDIIEYRDGFETFRTKIYNYMHKGNFFHYEIDKLLSLIDHAITNNVCDIFRLYTEITLLDETRNQSYKNFLDSSLVSILENYESQEK